MPKEKSVAGTSADATIRFVELQVKGETYSLAWDFNAIADVEKATGYKLLGGFQTQNMGFADVRGLLYAALQKAHPKITEIETGRLIQRAGIGKVLDVLAQAYTASTADPPEAGSAPAGS